ncbi:hypothetical protein JMJ77_0005915 [Colletotrichum scovillei]|uniref:Uncharacterized protein n=1 Tax=Colletotrichum scovillei TaxID=1209932 RepID=A0A9P7UMB7_9PEZI|nr:hypothetical protein JMJ77_0005915 [Colletotrichum scovillei]KAG7077144.1 hypothetical protein JMJ76_0014396 [Colletotrichum scovillei]KAG7084254.1 hypothetical protein JMJ78_0009692 [Colletotrichum scovillei]
MSSSAVARLHLHLRLRRSACRSSHAVSGIINIWQIAWTC